MASRIGSFFMRFPSIGDVVRCGGRDLPPRSTPRRRSKLRGVAVTYARWPRALTSTSHAPPREDVGAGPQEDLHVGPQGPPGDVQVVELDHLRKRHAATLDLPVAGHAG